MSNKGTEWKVFSDAVLDHIEDYAVPQYGDYPDDLAYDMTPEETVGQIKKYAARFSSNARGEVERKRDMLKIAHYACMAWRKLMDEENE